MEKRNLRDIRTEKGILQREIADYYGISQCYYSLIENGYRKPSLEFAKRIATAFNISLEDVYELVIASGRAK